MRRSLSPRPALINCPPPKLILVALNVKTSLGGGGAAQPLAHPFLHQLLSSCMPRVGPGAVTKWESV